MAEFRLSSNIRRLTPGHTPQNFGEADRAEVDTPLEVCEKRDGKGPYGKARAEEIQHFPGIHEAYEPPGDEALRVSFCDLSAEAMSVVEEIRLKRYNPNG